MDEVQPAAAVLEPPQPPTTGDAAVDGAVEALAAAVREPLDVDHALELQVAAFEAAHRALQDRLADVEG